MAILRISVKLIDLSNQSIPMSDRLKDLVVPFFRIFDSNGNGVIEQLEMNEILTDVVSGVANILGSLLDSFEPICLKVRIPEIQVLVSVFSLE